MDDVRQNGAVGGVQHRGDGLLVPRAAAVRVGVDAVHQGQLAAPEREARRRRHHRVDQLLRLFTRGLTRQVEVHREAHLTPVGERRTTCTTLARYSIAAGVAARQLTVRGLVHAAGHEVVAVVGARASPMMRSSSGTSRARSTA
jgi:hypothetical protein